MNKGGPPLTKRTWWGVVIAATVAAMVVLWLRPLGSSFALDETASFWIVSDGLGEAIRRSLEFGGGGPLYFVILWVAQWLGGPSEVVLRLPSVIAMTVSVALVVAIGRRLFDIRVGILAAAFMVTSGLIVYSAVDARPYAAALASFMTATFLLIRWLDEGRRRDAFGYVLAATTTFYLHYLVAIMMLSHIGYALVRRGSNSRIKMRTLIWAWLAVIALLLPLVPHLVDLTQRSSLLSSPIRHVVSRLTSVVFPYHVILLGAGTLAVAAALAWFRRTRLEVESSRSAPGGMTLLVSWITTVLVTLGAPALLLDVNTLETRYFLTLMPAQALLIARALRAVRSDAARMTAALLVVVGSIYLLRFPGHTNDNGILVDWRGVASIINAAPHDSRTPVLVSAGFIESRDPSWVKHPLRAQYLTSPFQAYPIKGEIVALPLALEDSEGTLRGLIGDIDLLEHDDVIYVDRLASTAMKGWFSRQLATCGYDAVPLDSSGEVLVTYFKRGQTTANCSL